MGRSKALLPFGDEVLLQRMVRVVGEVVGPVVVVAAPGQELPVLPPNVLVARDDQEYLGPLNGLAAGFAALDGLADVAYVSACDVPFLRPGFIRRILDRMDGVEIAMPEVGGFKHPLAAGYRVPMRDKVSALLGRGHRRLLDLTDVCRTRFLFESDFDDVGLESLRNLNTPEDYAASGFAADREAGNSNPS